MKDRLWNQNKGPFYTNKRDSTFWFLIDRRFIKQHQSLGECAKGQDLHESSIQKQSLSFTEYGSLINSLVNNLHYNIFNKPINIKWLERRSLRFLNLVF